MIDSADGVGRHMNIRRVRENLKNEFRARERVDSTGEMLAVARCR